MTKEKIQPNNEVAVNQETQVMRVPEGTYEYLKGMLAGGSDIRLFNTIRHKTWIRVFNEAECAETGGSCMDLLIRKRTRVGEITWSHAHVTQDDKIVRLKSNIEDKEGNRWDLPTPSLSDMLQTVQEMLPEK